MNLKNIPNFPHYCATENGKIWSKRYKRFITSYDGTRGGMLVVLCEQGKKFRKLVHRLILETFIGPCPEEMVCCHNDGNFRNNHINNLRWDTRSNNELDKHRHGTMTQAKLTSTDACLIVYCRKALKLARREIAKIFNVSIHTVDNIIYKKKWRHIWQEF